MKHQSYKEYFVSFYKGQQHIIFYKLVKSREELRDYIEVNFGKVSDLVIDQVV